MTSATAQAASAMERSALSFLHEVRFEDIPEDARRHARRSMLDLAGVAAAGLETENGRIVRGFAADFHGAGAAGARIMFDGRRGSPPGAAMAGAAVIDSLDAHDGHRLTKGHVGVVVLPALLAFADEIGRSGGLEFLTRFVVGYEIGTRAGMALHASAGDYHSSGAWNALAAAAIGARALGLDTERTRHALGAAEYYGPRSQMMRVIDHPTMLKDGATMGAFAGVSAALLAARGFTGAPALTVEGEAAAHIWEDLGARWLVTEQYLKPQPVCRWTQPAIEAALSLRDAAPARDIDGVRVVSFREAVRLAVRAPRDSEEAQYSLPFPVAAALVKGDLDAAAVSGAALGDPQVLRLSAAMVLEESEDYSARFPAERWAHVELRMKDGRTLRSPPSTARGDPERPLSDRDVVAKYKRLASPLLGAERAERLRASVADLEGGGDLDALLDDLLSAPDQD